MKNIKSLLGIFSSRATIVVAVILLASIGAEFPLLHAGAAQVTSRSVTLSNSAPAATGVTYKASFNTVTTGAIQGVVIDFCAGTPLLGDSSGCTAPTGFSLTSTPSVTETGLSGTNANWTAASGSPYQTLKYTYASGTSVASGTTVTLTIANVTNPNIVGTSGTPGAGTFYVRIATYATSAAATAYTSGSPGAYVDYGGLAITTAATINITARVIESLSFCVYYTACGDTPSITLGHGSNSTLDNTAVDTKPVNFSLATNAQYGAVVTMKGTTLTSGANTIPPANAGAATAGAITAGTAAFGMQITTPGSMTVAAPYNGTGSSYGFDTTSASNVSTTYGDQIASVTAPINTSVTTLTFAATVSATTPAGLYTAAEQLIATGTF